LPRDYKAFIDTYGSGIVGALEIQNPFHRPTNYHQWWSDWASRYEDLAKYEPIPYPLFPEPGGLLPFGTLGDVDTLNWLTTGTPDKWPFVYHDRAEGFFEIKPLTAVEFILEAVTQRSPLLIHLRSESAFAPPCFFEPYTDNPRMTELVHPHSLDLHAFADALASRWPADKLRITRKPDRVRMWVEPLVGSIGMSREGDERTWLTIHYDAAQADTVSELVRHAIDSGFSLIRSS
jgi:hypothetical protein